MVSDAAANLRRPAVGCNRRLAITIRRLAARRSPASGAVLLKLARGRARRRSSLHPQSAQRTISAAVPPALKKRRRLPHRAVGVAGDRQRQPAAEPGERRFDFSWPLPAARIVRGYTLGLTPARLRRHPRRTGAPCTGLRRRRQRAGARHHTLVSSALQIARDSRHHRLAPGSGQRMPAGFTKRRRPRSRRALLGQPGLQLRRVRATTCLVGNLPAPRHATMPGRRGTRACERSRPTDHRRHLHDEPDARGVQLNRTGDLRRSRRRSTDLAACACTSAGLGVGLVAPA